MASSMGRGLVEVGKGVAAGRRSIEKLNLQEQADTNIHQLLLVPWDMGADRGKTLEQSNCIP